MLKFLNIKTGTVSAMALAVFMVYIISGCKKTTSNPSPAVQMGTLIFHMHTFIDTAEVADTTKTYRNADGRMMKIHLAQLYISNIRLVKSDGTIFRPDSVILKNK